LKKPGLGIAALYGKYLFEVFWAFEVCGFSRTSKTMMFHCLNDNEANNANNV